MGFGGLFQAAGFLSTLFLSSANVVLSSALARRGMRFRGDPSTSILVIEVFKLLLASVWYLWARTRKRDQELTASSWRSRAWFVIASIRYAVPASLYLIMNSTIVFMVAEFGALNTVLLLNLKIPATGLLAWLVLGRHITSGQLAALGMLCVGTTLSQLPEDMETVGHGFRLMGLLYGLAYAFMSGLSGVFTEKLLRGGAEESLALQQVQLYFWGTLANLGVVYARGWRGPLSWDHPLIVSMIMAQVLTGLLTAWLLRTQGSYSRVFLHSLVGVCVGVFGFVVWGEMIHTIQLVAIFVIAGSIYAFRVLEATPAPPPDELMDLMTKKSR